MNTEQTILEDIEPNSDENCEVELVVPKTSKKSKKSALQSEQPDQIESIVDRMVHEPEPIKTSANITISPVEKKHELPTPIRYKKIKPKILGGQFMSTAANKRNFAKKPLHANIPNKTYNVI